MAECASNMAAADTEMLMTSELPATTREAKGQAGVVQWESGVRADSEAEIALQESIA